MAPSKTIEKLLMPLSGSLRTFELEIINQRSMPKVPSKMIKHAALNSNVISRIEHKLT